MKRIAFFAGLLGLSSGQTTGAPTMAPTHDCGCTGDAEADINRIEYQIPMDHSIMRGRVRGVIEDFVEYLDGIIEDQMFHGIFDIKKDKSEEYYRTDRTKECESNDRRNPDIPKSIGIKYRQTCDVNGFVNEKYQNDFSVQMGLGRSCAAVEPTKDYDGIFKCKNEANMFADETWCDAECDGMQALDYLVDGGNGYTGRLEFDDDPMYGYGDADAVTVIREPTFTNFPFDCPASKLDDYFLDFCREFLDGIMPTDMTCTVDKDVVNFVRDIEFEVNRVIGGVKTEVSEGKLTFQVRFDTKADARNDRPTGRETEMSVKAYRDDTLDGQWDYVVDILNQVVDAITCCGYPYIRYDNNCPRSGNPDCPVTGKPSLSPTYSPGYIPQCCKGQLGASSRWQNKCPTFFDAGSCLKGRKSNFCEWVDC